MLDVGCTQILLQLALQDIGQLTDIERGLLNTLGSGCRDQIYLNSRAAIWTPM